MMTAKSIALASSAALILTGASAAQVVLSDRNASVDPGASPASWIYYEVSGGFAGIRHGLRILDDGQAFARESVSGRLVAQASGIVALEDLESLDASVRAVFRGAAAGSDGCQGADHLHSSLKSAVRGFPESLQTCAPTAEEQALFQELDAVRAQVLAGPKDGPVKLLDGKILLSDASGVRQGGVSILTNGQAAVWTSSDGRRNLERFRLDATAMQLLADSIDAASADAVSKGVQDAWGPKIIIDYGPPPMQPHEPSRSVLNSSAGNGPVPPGGGVWDPGSDDVSAIGAERGRLHVSLASNRPLQGRYLFARRGVPDPPSDILSGDIAGGLLIRASFAELVLCAVAKGQYPVSLRTEEGLRETARVSLQAMQQLARLCIP